ncbi:Uncharacterised protein [Mycobacterium tuberculosis]|uniref:Uncharacterized protein n=1 Tax=Mycobacterium tuberculosis TaxID=1773 RepID=A0A654U3E4_MYCTX|nr:Uncharacterised protein [Mycobacterium tuberculosis]SGN98912.1 Uncharacterised protein [Mycobacterium tuberculosis]
MHPGTAWDEDQHRRGFGGHIFAAPYVEQLGRVVAVEDATAVDVTAVAQRPADRRRALRRRPFDGKVVGRNDAA